MWASIWRWFGFSTPMPLGARGEVAAARFLRRLGYRILARQVRESGGELDLIALDGRVIVFVEVKTRSSTDAGHPADAVDLRKQQRITRAALAFLRRHRLLDHPIRFDIVAIVWPAGTNRPLIQHYRHAFESPERWQFYG
jgi:putative endonuclease